MALYRKVYNQKKADDRGFTLVELVIVVAILAVLVGMLAPQYTKYVEKARKSSDVSNMDKMIEAIRMCAIDSDYPEMTIPNGKKDDRSFYYIYMDKSGTDIKKADQSNPNYQLSIYHRERPLNMTKAMKEYAGENWINLTMKSKKWGADKIMVRCVVMINGTVFVDQCEPPAFKEALFGEV